MKAPVLLLSTTTVAIQVTSAQAPAPRHAQSPVEEIYIARSLRESRTAPTAFCAAGRTGHADVQFEDRYTFRSIATRSSDGRVTDANIQAIGHPFSVCKPQPRRRR